MVQISNNPTTFTSFQLEKTNFALERDYKQLSTGKRINGARDDAAGSGIATRLFSQVKGIQQAIKNTEDGYNVLQTAEGGLQEMTTFLQRARSLAIMAANDVLTSADRADIQLEIDQIIEEMDRLSSAVQFNQLRLLYANGSNPEAETITLHVGPNQNESLDLSVGMDARAQTLGIDTMDVTSQSSAEAAIAIADTALTRINELRSRIGAEEHQLESVLGALDIQDKTMTMAHSAIEDADIANVLVSLTRDQIISNSGVASSAQANNLFKGSLGQIINMVS